MGVRVKKDNLTKNITDQMKEAQLKLGYAEETTRLIFPLSSLNAILSVNARNAEEMKAILEEAYAVPAELGALSFTVRDERIEIGVPPEGARYVNEQVKAPEHLAALIALFRENHHCSLEQIKAVFDACGNDYVCERMPEGEDFDYVFSFSDASVDRYYYCIKMEMGHTVYHRFSKEDFLSLQM